ncbi:MAG: isoprenyl transferase [Planctomycetota bacterium]
MKLPNHIAIIMDGNGRWAREKGFSRVKGHEKGAQVVNEIIREAAKIHLKRLTLYAFSSENWKRPRYEINFLMRLLNKYLIKEEKEIMENNIRFTTIGRTESFPNKTRELIDQLTKKSSSNTGLTLCLALNYGARSEIVDATKKICQAFMGKKVALDDINEETFKKYFYDPDMTDPDLLIRTGGEYRLSNFLLYQMAYTEFYITTTYWPDFTTEHFHKTIEEYNHRERRFGGIK